MKLAAVIGPTVASWKRGEVTDEDARQRCERPAFANVQTSVDKTVALCRRGQRDCVCDGKTKVVKERSWLSLGVDEVNLRSWRRWKHRKDERQEGLVKKAEMRASSVR